jgi:hypothetical protein
MALDQYRILFYCQVLLVFDLHHKQYLLEVLLFLLTCINLIIRLPFHTKTNLFIEILVFMPKLPLKKCKVKKLTLSVILV